MGEVQEERQVQDDRGGQDGVAAEEVHLDLHGVAHPSEDVDGVPALLVVATGWVVVDANHVVDVAVELRVGLRLEDRVQHAQLGHLLGLEVLRVVQYLAVPVPQDVGGVPAAQAQHPGLEAGGQHGLHEGLAGLEVLAGDRHAAAGGQLDHARQVDAQVRCAVGERHVAHQRGVDVDLAGGDVLVVGTQAGLERLDGVVYGAGFLVGLGRAAPDHDQAVALVLDAEPLDVVDQRLGLVPHGGLGLDPGAVQFLYPALVEDGVHGDDALQLGRDGSEVLLLEHAAGVGGLQHVGRDGIPAAEDNVVQFGQRHELADERVAVLAATTQADVGHLADRSDRSGQAVAGGDHACDEGGCHCAHTGGEYPEAAGGWCDFKGCVHGGSG